MTLDLFVGFEQEPTGLEDFMNQQGYTFIERHDDSSGGYLIFERDDHYWPCIFYTPHTEKAKDPEEVPNWERSGRTIVSDVNINFPHGDIVAFEEARRLSEQLVKGLHGILYDPDLDDYFTKDNI